MDKHTFAGGSNAGGGRINTPFTGGSKAGGGRTKTNLLLNRLED